MDTYENPIDGYRTSYMDRDDMLCVLTGLLERDTLFLAMDVDGDEYLSVTALIWQINFDDTLSVDLFIEGRREAQFSITGILEMVTTGKFNEARALLANNSKLTLASSASHSERFTCNYELI